MVLAFLSILSSPRDAPIGSVSDLEVVEEDPDDRATSPVIIEEYGPEAKFAQHFIMRVKLGNQ